MKTAQRLAKHLIEFGDSIQGDITEEAKSFLDEAKSVYTKILECVRDNPEIVSPLIFLPSYLLRLSTLLMATSWSLQWPASTLPLPITS